MSKSFNPAQIVYDDLCGANNWETLSSEEKSSCNEWIASNTPIDWSWLIVSGDVIVANQPVEGDYAKDENGI